MGNGMRASVCVGFAAKITSDACCPDSAGPVRRVATRRNKRTYNRPIRSILERSALDRRSENRWKIPIVSGNLGITRRSPSNPAFEQSRYVSEERRDLRRICDR